MECEVRYKCESNSTNVAHTTMTTLYRELPLNGLFDAFEINEAELDEQRHLVAPVNTTDEEVDPESQFWVSLRRQHAFLQFTNFTEEQVLSMYQELSPYLPTLRRRGPAPICSNADALLYLLVWMKLALDYGRFSHIVKVKDGRLRDAIVRIKGPLFEMLHNKWWNQRRRPVPLDNTEFPHIALLIDNTSIEVYHPKVPFDDAKSYWDVHNSIYALKKEVGIMASAPHYALFSQPKRIGGIHDYTELKETYCSYLEYLQKTVDEHTLLLTDEPNASWAALLDRAYVGPASDTPGLRRITPKKRAITATDTEYNMQVDHIRVPVEQFFGRMYQLWAVLRNVYRWDHSNFDTDFDLAVLLTNEQISHTPLQESDREFYLQVSHSKKLKMEAKKRKRITEQRRYIATKRRRLEQSYGTVPHVHHHPT